MSMHADMDIILSDLLNGDECPYGDIIKKGQDEAYYSGFGIYLSRQLETNEQYFNLMMGLAEKFKTLEDPQKEMLKNKMEIFPETIVKEKIIYKQQKSKKNVKPKLNTKDDY